jgi:hydrogenase maturation protease
MRLVLIGIGSPFGDDTLGWQLVDALAARGLRLAGWDVSFSRADRPGPSLLDRLQAQDAAIIIDAMHLGGSHGSVRLVQRDELEASGSLLSGHALGVAETLELGEKLGMLPPRLEILGIEMGAGLPSEAVDEAADLVEGLFGT